MNTPRDEAPPSADASSRRSTLTERLSRSRRSRFASNMISGEPRPRSLSRPRRLEIETKKSEDSTTNLRQLTPSEKRIALAKAYRRASTPTRQMTPKSTAKDDEEQAAEAVEATVKPANTKTSPEQVGTAPTASTTDVSEDEQPEEKKVFSRSSQLYSRHRTQKRSAAASKNDHKEPTEVVIDNESIEVQPRLRLGASPGRQRDARFFRSASPVPRSPSPALPAPRAPSPSPMRRTESPAPRPVSPSQMRGRSPRRAPSPSPRPPSRPSLGSQISAKLKDPQERRRHSSPTKQLLTLPPEPHRRTFPPAKIIHGRVVDPGDDVPPPQSVKPVPKDKPETAVVEDAKSSVVESKEEPSDTKEKSQQQPSYLQQIKPKNAFQWRKDLLPAEQWKHKPAARASPVVFPSKSPEPDQNVRGSPVVFPTDSIEDTQMMPSTSSLSDDLSSSLSSTLSSKPGSVKGRWQPQQPKNTRPNLAQPWQKYTQSEPDEVESVPSQDAVFDVPDVVATVETSSPEKKPNPWKQQMRKKPAFGSPPPAAKGENIEPKVEQTPPQVRAAVPNYLEQFKQRKQPPTPPQEEVAEDDSPKQPAYLRQLRKTKPAKSAAPLPEPAKESTDGNPVGGVSAASSVVHPPNAAPKAPRYLQLAQMQHTSEEEEEKKDEDAAEEPAATIETPGRVSVASMKARYGTPNRCTSPVPSDPGPSRPAFVTSFKTPASVRASPAAQGTVDDTSLSQSTAPRSAGSVVGRYQPPSRSPATPVRSFVPKPAGRVKVSPKPVAVAVAQQEPAVEEDPVDESKTGSSIIETPDKVNVSSMAARFSQPTASSASKRTPGRPTSASRASIGSGNTVKPPKSLRSESPVPTEYTNETPSASPAVEQSTGSGRSAIETPERVSVANMKGLFGKSGTKVVLGGRSAAQTPYNTPSTPVRTVPDTRTDVSTPHGPAIPNRVVSSAPAWRNQTPVESKSSLPKWPLVEPDQAKTPPKEQSMSGPPSARARETDGIAQPELEDPVGSNSDVAEHLVQQSPRDRPTNIPRWKSIPNGDEKKPSVTKSKASSRIAEKEGFEVIPGVADEEPTVLKPTALLTGDQMESAENVPRLSTSPRNDKPWNQDMATLSPTNWNRRVQSAFDDSAEFATESKPVSSSKPTGTGLVVKAGSKVSRLAELNAKLIEGGHEAGRPKNTFSLAHLAVDSIHAMDFERAMLADLAKKSSSGDDEESELSAGINGSIPQDLPPEFSKALQKDKPKFLPRMRAVEQEKSGNDEAGIVFGDPSTYGAAGGEEAVQPPKVADRARAIAQWKGGLGVRPSNSGSDSSQQPVLELIETSSSDILVGDPLKARDQKEEASNRPETNKDAQAPKKPVAGNPRGAAAVLRIWSSTSQDELDAASEWMNCDPELEASALDSSAQESPVKASPPKKPGKPLPKSLDPFLSDSFLGIDATSPAKKKNSISDAAFDPFWDVGDDEPIEFESTTMDFFNAKIQVREPVSPAKTDFSAPNFEPKALMKPTADSFKQNNSKKKRRSRSKREC